MDNRLIENIEPYQKNALQLVNEMRPVTFNKKNSRKKQLGLTAQNVGELEPMLVLGTANGLQIDYDQLVILLVKSVRELTVEVNELRSQLEQKKSKK